MAVRNQIKSSEKLAVMPWVDLMSRPLDQVSTSWVDLQFILGKNPENQSSAQFEFSGYESTSGVDLWTGVDLWWSTSGACHWDFAVPAMLNFSSLHESTSGGRPLTRCRPLVVDLWSEFFWNSLRCACHAWVSLSLCFFCQIFLNKKVHYENFDLVQGRRALFQIRQT